MHGASPILVYLEGPAAGEACNRNLVVGLRSGNGPGAPRRCFRYGHLHVPRRSEPICEAPEQLGHHRFDVFSPRDATQVAEGLRMDELLSSIRMCAIRAADVGTACLRRLLVVLAYRLSNGFLDPPTKSIVLLCGVRLEFEVHPAAWTLLTEKVKLVNSHVDEKAFGFFRHVAPSACTTQCLSILASLSAKRAGLAPAPYRW